MFKALLVAGASVAFGQCAFDSDNKCPTGCVATTGTCYRNNFVNTSIGVCSTDSKTCETGNNCAAGTNVMKAETCSTCADSCATYTSNTTCLSDVNRAQCAWIPPACYNATVMAPTPCSKTTKADCIAEAGCFYYSVAATQCGVTKTISTCASCSATIWTNSLRSGLKNNVGNTCSWPVAAPFVSAFSLKINDVALSSDAALCPAFTAASSMVDNVAVSVAVATGIFSAGVPFSATTAATPTCVQASSAAAVLPGLAVLVAMALA